VDPEVDPDSEKIFSDPTCWPLLIIEILFQIEYTMELKFEGKTYVAAANQKKAAKTACATEAWNEIRPRLG